MTDLPAAPAWIERATAPRRPTAEPPLLVLLHGIGADENDLFPLAAAVDPRFHVVSVRAPHDYAIGYAWFQIDFLADGTLRPRMDEALQALTELRAWLRAAPARFGTDPARTYVLGFSQGAMMALGVLQTDPTLLAGVVALSGRAPDGLFDAAADRATIGRVPLYIAHGLYDDVLPVENGRHTRDVFKDVSEDLTYEEYPVPHGVSPEEMQSVAVWLESRLERQSPVGSNP